MGDSINKRFRLGQSDNYDSLTQFALPGWVNDNTNFSYGQRMVGPDIIDAGQQSNPVINHTLRAKPYSPEYNFVQHIPKYAFMFAISMDPTRLNSRPHNIPHIIVSLEQLNYILHDLQLKMEAAHSETLMSVQWVKDHVTYLGVNNSDRSNTYATGMFSDCLFD
jgi:hypothetical protein